MGIQIDVELLEDINNPDIEVINHCIAIHRSKISDLDKLDQYYNGKHEIFTRTRDNEKAKNAKVMVNHAKYTTDIVVGFFLGNPIAYTAGGDEKNIQTIQDVYDEIDIASHDTELGKDLSVFGEGLELLYLKETDGKVEERIAAIDPRGGFIVTDDTIERNVLFGVYYYEKKGLNNNPNGFLFNVYTKQNIIVYRSSGQSIETNSKPILFQRHYWGDVPMNEFRNNEERQGDFEQLISLIDAINNLQSDRISDKEAFVESMLIVYGFTLEDTTDDSEDGSDKMIEAPSREDGADVDWLTKMFNESEVQVLAQSLEENLHKVSYVPNLNDQNFHGNVSGEAMKYKMFGLLMLLATKARYLTKGLRRRLELMENMINIRHAGDDAVDVSGTTIKISPNLPVNVSDIIDQIRNSQEFVPLLISLGWLPDVDNPEEVIEQLYAQKEQELKLRGVALGLSHDDKNEDEDKEGDDTDDRSDI